MKADRFRGRLTALMLGGLGVIGIGVGHASMPDSGSTPPVKLNTTADHARFKELQREFKSGPEVTKACLICHTEAARQVHRTKHWTWEFVNPDTGQRLGKKTLVNNYCVSIRANYPFCTACHVGYGWQDKDFDFTSEQNVDCLVCHDTTGDYRKQPGLSGHPASEEREIPKGSGNIVKPVDLRKVAQKVGKTSRDTCGACHFFGGGGDGVKHGDLDSSLSAPDKPLDVHMDATGADFTCATCHATSSHDIPGSRYTPTAMDKKGAMVRGQTDKRNPATCQSCHGVTPHKVQARLNAHARKIACQTCHIPAMARGGVPTKMSWDWSTAGKRGPDGKPLVVKDEKGRVIYDAKKGDFVIAENVMPEYAWFNGHVTYTLVGDKLERTDGVIGINRIGGSPTDGKSRIWPFKVSRGAQPYDSVNMNLVTPHTAGDTPTAYWKHLDWAEAIETGMEDFGLPFSGKFDFVQTEMYWPLSHMVAPKEKAVGCAECHSRDGRLKDIKGVYLPRRDAAPWLDLLGWSAAALALLGVLLHGGLRIVRGWRE
ncbi:MAG: cytochrome C [Betaproteobacteria bacterium RIFCSPLOWO2_02_FULL_66_14]|nr:MAG: cytochrome C [Betaproteobacteria bacterium RIFCSPLOWO2_02_FULL_66_14]